MENQKSKKKMGSTMLCIFRPCDYSRLVTVAVSSLALFPFLCIAQEMPIDSQPIIEWSNEKTSSVVEMFNNLEESGCDIVKGKQFLQKLITELNDQFMADLSFEKAMTIIEEQLDCSVFPEDMIEPLRAIILAFKSEDPVDYSLLSKSVASIKRSDKVPATMVVGCVELLAGGLMCILPWTRWVGGMMIADGLRRVYDGVEHADGYNHSMNGRQVVEKAVSKALIPYQKKSRISIRF